MPAKRFLETMLNDIHRMLNDLNRLHATQRNMAHLIYLDNSEGIHGFKALGKFTIFFSYESLSWDQAGPGTIQFNAMTESLKIIARRLHLDMAGIYVWLDIPQQNQRLKALAVKSLYTYARQADAIIIVAPDSQHHNKKIPANLQT